MEIPAGPEPDGRGGAIGAQFFHDVEHRLTHVVVPGRAEERPIPGVRG